MEQHLSMPSPKSQPPFSPERKERRHTSESRPEEPRRSRVHLNNIESSVTRLLVATKQLLEALTSWSQNQTTENKVSDIYVKLGNEFNMACAAFSAVGVDTSNLAHVPDDLRYCLEKCLSEDPSPGILELYLPQIREIIIFLLQGLKEKQMSYRASRQIRSSRSTRQSIDEDSKSDLGGDRASSPSSANGGLKRTNAHMSQRSSSSITSPRGEGLSSERESSPISISNESIPIELPQLPDITMERSKSSSSLSLKNPPQRPPRNRDQERLIAANDPMILLKKSEALERRASRRYSAYAFAKISGAPIPVMPTDDSPRRQRQERSNSQRPSNEIFGRKTKPTLNGLQSHIQSEPIKTDSSPRSTGITTIIEETVPPTSPDSPSLGSVLYRASSDNEPEDPRAPKTLFLQLGKEIKKVRLEGEVTIPALRMLFVEKFAYTPGSGDFPGIYLRDPTSGVQYELEDLNEVRNHSVLSLNVEVLDEVKRHIDESVGALAKELNALKKTLGDSQEAIMNSVSKVAEMAIVSVPRSPRRSDINSTTTTTIQNFDESSRKVVDITEIDSQARVAVDLRTQFDNVQNLRRDIAVMRQYYNEFMGDARSLMKKLQCETENVKQSITSAPVSSARGVVDAGRSRVDSMSQELVTRMEELQDMVDGIKLDLLQRRARISPTTMNRTTKEMEKMDKDLNQLSEDLNNFRPQWKTTWEKELQNIVDEQQFLNHQVQLVQDMKDDFSNVKSVYENISKVFEHQSKNGVLGGGIGRGYRPPTPDENHEGIKTVMLQVKGLDVDSSRRLKAIEAVEKQRQKELASRIDEFTAELAGFVENKKLKKVGGAEEVERLRAKRDEEAWKTMFQSAPAPPSTSLRGKLRGKSKKEVKEKEGLSLKGENNRRTGDKQN